jgi:hypothetical protein
MPPDFRSLWSSAPPVSAPPAVPIVPGTPRPVAPAAPDPDRSCRQPFVNPRRNSRLAVPLPAGTWSVAGEATWDRDFRPRHVLHFGDRTLVQGEASWRLLDAAGREIAWGNRYAGDVYLNAEAGTYLLADSIGSISIRRLSDGRETVAARLNFGDVYARGLLAMRGGRLLAASTEHELHVHSDFRPEHSILEVCEVFDPPRVEPESLPVTSQPVADLYFKTLTLPAAVGGDTVTVATEDTIFTTDWDLRIRSVLAGEFTPTALSVDELGRAHLVVAAGRRRELWRVAPDGTRHFATEIPAEAAEISVPPLIAHDHRVFVVADGAVFAYSAEGRLVREHRPTGELAGATVTADDRLLMAAGARVSAVDAEGRERVLFECPDGQIFAPPILTADGEMLVATRERLHRLAAG